MQLRRGRPLLEAHVASGADRRSARQPQPPAVTLNELGCYHFRVFDPRVPLSRYPMAFLGTTP